MNSNSFSLDTVTFSPDSEPTAAELSATFQTRMYEDDFTFGELSVASRLSVGDRSEDAESEWRSRAGALEAQKKVLRANFKAALKETPVEHWKIRALEEKRTLLNEEHWALRKLGKALWISRRRPIGPEKIMPTMFEGIPSYHRTNWKGRR